jgi:hypothetical protein
MLKNVTQLEHKVGERVFHLLCDPSSPLNEVKEALCAFLKYVGNIEDNVAAQQAAKNKHEKESESLEEEKPL